MHTLSRIVFAAILVMSQISPADPWFTGPLLAPPAQTVARGDLNIFFDAGVSISDSIYNRTWQRIPVSTYTSSQIAPQLFYGLTDFVTPLIQFTATW